MAAIRALQDMLMAKIPLWQVVVLGGTTLIAGRVLQRGLRSLHTSRASDKARKGAQRADGEAEIREDVKMVLIARDDLKMAKGKVAAQCAHAALMCYKRAQREAPAALRRWEAGGQAKVALRCATLDEMHELAGRARALGLVVRVVADAGRTQVAAGSQTVLGIGPGPVGLVNRVSGHLRLL
ncbi:hypothetical protein LPJ63_002455 [Coemansia sp. RSA 2711]|nr:hypothetical protein LPJ63_002455 [Coemansia sp. RSA 2711]KAJ2308363.1 hypothetical protein IWW54_004093 [Coemansia sp. RSA 2705]KAJ2316235.1 hypothetical protein IWW52_003743 [Coemansia sp. RSA 2704]KAJ2365354.1 hypothetical protein H4S01_003292 [Coemansia sp. RSA 2610]KAJ2387968.1 hypothetical protein H4S02_003102 [Coemansia sp. RSA 2611]